jgi:hypothetical protein
VNEVESVPVNDSDIVTDPDSVDVIVDDTVNDGVNVGVSVPGSQHTQQMSQSTASLMTTRMERNTTKCHEASKQLSHQT